MNSLLQEVIGNDRGDLITPKLIKDFHSRIGKDLGIHLDAIPGKFREDNRVVGNDGCPDPRDVPELVEKLCNWLKLEFGYASVKQPLYQAIVEAIVAHVYVEWIHPFGDENGRTGRLIEFYIMLRAGMPDIASHILSSFYNLTRPEYYRQLDHARKAKDLSEFIRYALQGLYDGLKDTLEVVQKAQFDIAWTSHVYEVMNKQKIAKQNVLARRRKLVLEMEIGKCYSTEEISLMSPTVAREYGKLSEATLQRDLTFLEKKCDLIKRDGKSYSANSSVLHLTMAQRRT